MIKINHELKTKISEVIWSVLIIIIIFLIFCIYGLRTRADDLQAQLDQCIEVEEQHLNPCPMCGNNVKLNPINDSFYIECEQWMGKDGCGLTTGYYDSKTELIEQWNKMKFITEEMKDDSE